MIKPVESDKPKKNFKFDARKNKFIGYRVDVRVWNGKGKSKRHRPIYPTRKQAETAELELQLKSKNKRLGIEAETPGEITLEELFEKRLARIENRSERVRSTRVFQCFVDLTGARLVADVKTSDFNEFILHRESEGVKPQTVNREMTCLITAFRQASSLFKELADYQPPVVKRPRFKKVKREKVVSEAEKDLICSYLGREKEAIETVKEFENRVRIARMFALAWYLGLRFSEVARLKKTDYRKRDKTLRVIRWKTGNVTTFKFLPDEVIQLLDEANRASETDYIFTISGSYPKNFYPLMKEACEENNILYGRDVKDGLTFHSNRHAFTTRLIQVTDLATAQDLTGLSTRELLAHYGHASDDSRKKAMDNLYGQNPQDKLKEIYVKVRSGEMNLSEFLEAISG